MLAEVVFSDLIIGLCLAMFHGGFVCLQYVDATILFLEKDLDKTVKLKMVMYFFEHIFCMKINYGKSKDNSFVAIVTVATVK